MFKNSSSSTLFLIYLFNSLTVIATGFTDKGNQSAINTPQISAAEYFQGKTSTQSNVGTSSSNLAGGFPKMPSMNLDVPDFLRKN